MAGFNKWSILDAQYLNERGEKKRVFEPHKAQLQMMEDPARFLVCICGRRLGKSNMCGHDPLIPEAFRAKSMALYLREEGKRHEYWTVGPKYSDAEKTFRVFWNNCKRLGIPFDKPGSYYSPGTSSPMVVSLWDGAFIYQAKSSQDPDALVGEALSGVHLDEAAKMKQIVWTQMLQPSLADFKGWARFTTTPEGKNWIYDLFMDAVKPHKIGWNGHRIPSWYNTGYGNPDGSGLQPPFPEPTIDEHVKIMMRTMDENPGLTAFEIRDSLKLTIDSEICQQADSNTVPMFNQEFGAEFTDFVGKVFKGFDAETHCRRLKFNPNWETVACVDYGFSNPNVWLLVQIGPWGEINIIDELYQENLAPDEFADEVLRRGLVPDSCHSFYPDPALPGYTKTLETIFRKAGKRCRARPHTGGELNDRLNLIRAVIKNQITDNEASAEQWTKHPAQQDKKRPQLLIDDATCPKTVYEFGEYRYPDKKKEEAETSTKRYDTPMKKDDHCPEAFGRMMASRYHDHATQMGGGTRVSHAKFIRSLAKVSDKTMGKEPKGIQHATTPKRRGGWAANR